MSEKATRIALTPGEPAGIGPDICIQAAQQPLPASITVIADPDLLLRRARKLGLHLRLKEYTPGTPPMSPRAGTLEILPIHCGRNDVCVTPDPINADYVLSAIRRAVQGCRDGEFAALVTGPVNKGVINSSGVAFTGHTEYLAAMTHTRQAVMMLCTPGLRVALVTTHLPLKDVFGEITRDRVETTLRITADGLRRFFRIDSPRLLVCGLNPHAGEEGNLGMEEIEVIRPVLDRLRGEGMLLTGPKPADTAFIPDELAQVDAVIAMYHDQGLPVLKHAGFGRAVNVTLGLPLVRTSVDHGTALELAGTGLAETGSLTAAIVTAAEMAGNAAKYPPRE